MSRDQTKAAQYIQQLDDARCQGDWDSVLELVRKIKKHAPQRTCLTTTAEAEHTVAQIHASKTARPITATSLHPPDITQHIPLLLESIEKEQTYKEDRYQAQVCLGWIHWELAELALATSRLPKGIEDEFSQLDGTDHETADWTKVCAVKASYIRGTSQYRSGATAEALETFDSALPIIANSPGAKQGKELQSWTELYLTSFCMISSIAIRSRISSILETETLSAFRNWAKFWDRQFPAPTGGRAAKAEVLRRDVWKEYYTTLSTLLREDLPFPTSALTTTYTEASTRLQQRVELKKVEARYETLLLSEVQFPRAEEASGEVEAFVDVAIRNWRILCGGDWKEQDLGEGGAEAVSRGVLDILYRAATKTFHSTAILRHLFTVHLAVAEFELAFKAFDTYMDIVKKGKARAEKTGELETGLDDDETVLVTASECIKALCRYGSRNEIEKAKDLCQFFEDWLEKHYPITSQTGNAKLNNTPNDYVALIAPEVFASTWRSIGIGHAQWARSTYDATLRSDIQLRALKCFRKALLPQFESSKDVETLFALGTLLAERRELGPAIEVVKSALLLNSSRGSSSGTGVHPRHFIRERSLIPLWHLMALLLSARQEFVTAARSCEGAFEQFEDPKNLFGDSLSNGLYRSTHLNEKLIHSGNAVVDDMDDLEKENVLEVKMTQLALIEVLEGPDVAVNASDELLSLYARLFGDLQSDLAPLNPPTAVPPQSSAGTMRSIKGSIFGRTGRSVRKTTTSSGDQSASSLRPQTTQTMKSVKAPTIHITNENGTAAKQRPFTRDSSAHYHEKLQKRPGSLSRKAGSGNSTNRSPSKDRKRSTSRKSSSIHSTEDEKAFAPSLDAQNQDTKIGNGRDSESVSRGPLMNSNRKTTPSKLTTTGPLKSSIKETSSAFAHQDPTSAQAATSSRIPHSPSKFPVTRFPRYLQTRLRTAILIKVWLLISGFYRRASMFEDAKGAIDEAETMIKNLETEVSKDTNSSFSISDAGWGAGKGVAELWSDIESERGYLALAEEAPYIALAHFESALTHFADHSSAIVGLSNILLDIYTEDLLPPPTIPNLVLPGSISTPSSSTVNTIVTPNPLSGQPPPLKQSSSVPTVPYGPLGLPPSKTSTPFKQSLQDTSSTPNSFSSRLQPSYKDSSTALLDRLAARDRAYGLLTTLTKLGTGWNHSEAWFALARAHEEGGQPDKAREVLWWCVELEEGRAIRDWGVAGGGGYIL